METVVLSDDNEIPVLGLSAFVTECPGDTTAAITTAIECGVRRFEVFELYGNATTIGNALRQSNVPRDQLWVTVVLWTKGQTYHGILDAYRAVLYELGLDAADAVVLHACVNPNKLPDQWRALEQLKKDGQVKSIGLGRCPLQHVEDLLKQCQIMPAFYQDEISPFHRDVETLNYLTDNHVAVMTTNCVRGVSEPLQPAIAHLEAEHACSGSDMCIQWARQKEMLVSIGNLPRQEMERAVQTVQSPKFTLGEEQIAQLDSLNERLASSDER